jgi:uncharacterized lipoprotein
MTIGRVSIAVAAMTLISGCHSHLFAKMMPDCHRSQEYQRAAQVAPLKVPEGLDAPNVQGALVIPAVEVGPPPAGPHDACLDEPPRYKSVPSSKPATG